MLLYRIMYADFNKTLKSIIKNEKNHVNKLLDYRHIYKHDKLIKSMLSVIL